MTAIEIPIHASSISDSLALDNMTPRSPIRELQSAFDTILQARGEKSKRKGQSTSGIEAVEWARKYAPDTSYQKPHWTGCFELFSFPRELRDRIYFHFVFRPKGLTYRRHYTVQCESWPYSQHFATWPYGDNDLHSLFLTSRQVYEEALYVFCASNTIHIEKRHYSPLAGTLRIFPDKPARLLQSISLEYEDYDPNRHEEWRGPRPSAKWEKMIKDAYIAKEFFPKLREFNAQWQTRPEHFEEFEDMSFQDATEEQKMGLWLGWFRRQYERMHMDPPKWLFVTLWSPWRDSSMANNQSSWNKAMEVFREEIRVRGLKKSKDELEESGKKWLEETRGDGRRQRSKVRKSDAVQGR